MKQQVKEADQTLIKNAPLDEDGRLAALHSYHILDTIEEKDFDDLTYLASTICQMPIALVSFVDKDRQWFKSHKGLTASETAREYSFCAHAIAAPDPLMIIGDASKDSRFAHNPLVTGDPKIAFYAGVPIINTEGYALGTLCVLDNKVRELTAEQIEALKIIARQVTDKLELRKKNYELQEAAKKINESEKRFRNLVKLAPVAMAIYIGPDMIIEAANDHILEIWGKDKSIINMPLLEARPEIKSHLIETKLQEIYKTGEEYLTKAIQGPVLRNGIIEQRFYDAVYKPFMNTDGKVEGIIVAIDDVTENVLNQQKTDELNQRLEIALDAGELGSYDLNLVTGNILSNEQYKINFGIDADVVFNFPDLINSILPEYREEVKIKMNNALAENKLYHSEYPITWPDKSIHWISIHGKPRYDEKGKPVGMIGVTNDITQNKLQDQRKDDFLSIASHELKTPITSLKGALQLLNIIKHEPNSPMHIKLIEQSNKSLEKMSSLIDHFLNVNRIVYGQLKLEKSHFNIGTLLNDISPVIRLAAKYELIFKGDENLKIYADEHRIEQVVINFINNAVKYAADSKVIHLLAEKQDNFVKISVKDFGPGIPADEQPFLFERYYRAKSTAKMYSGLGLGLYISAEIVKKHDGEIGVESENGHGSTFWFTIPVTEV